jgi:hypothetical protein
MGAGIWAFLLCWCLFARMGQLTETSLYRSQNQPKFKVGVFAKTTHVHIYVPFFEMEAMPQILH